MGDTGVAGALIKVADQLLPVLATGGVFWVISYTMAVAMGIRAAWKLKLHNDNPSHYPLGSAITTFFITAALFSLPSAMDTVRETFGFATISDNPLAYAQNNSGAASAIEKAVYVYAAFFGYLAFLRGLMILNKGAEPSKRGDEFARGLTHLVGAILATNLGEFVGWLKGVFT